LPGSYSYKESRIAIHIIESCRNITICEEPKTRGKISLKKTAVAMGITRMERRIVYFLTTTLQEMIAEFDIRDPSFINWPLLGYAGTGNISLQFFPLSQ